MARGRDAATSRNWKRRMLIVIGGLVAFYLLALGTVFVLQRNYIYLPDDRRAALAETEAADLLTEIRRQAADGGSATSWYRPPDAADRPLLVLLQGNAGHIGDRLFKIAPFLRQGWGVLLVGYRGYGGNPGRPTEQGLYADARAALGFLGETGITPDRWVLYGESLGSGVAVQMAQEYGAGVLVLEAPFTSLADMAQLRFPYFPSRWLVRDRFDSLAKIGALDMPVLVIHGALDRVTPAALGRRLFDAAREPKALHVFPDAGHVDLYDHDADRVVIEFVEKAMRPPG